MLMPFIESYDLLVEPWRRGFSTSQRPLPDNCRYVTHFTPDYYDFAILHIDQQSIYQPDKHETLSKGRIFQEVLSTIREQQPDLPVVVINHMTPFHDRLENDVVVDIIKKMTAGCHMIVNSHTSRDQWGWGEVITHGIFADEWGFDVEHYKLTGEVMEAQKEPRCVIVLSPAGMEKAYRREFAREVVRRLEEYNVPTVWVGMDSSYKFSSYDEYRDFMAKSLVHFFPAWQSPRPRSRTEAMMSGQCIVTTPYHEADQMIIDSGSLKQTVENGVKTDEKLIYSDKTTGFLTSMNPAQDPRTIGNPQYVADLIRHLVIEEPGVALEIGKRGQKWARENLNHSVFWDQWKKFLVKINVWKNL
jgi:hypothetical protein